MKYQTVGTESGSYGNLTISRGRFGQYKRSRVTPLNPRTVAQAKVREIMTSLAESWRALTDAQMAVWDAFAKDKGMVGTGMQAFMTVNYRTVVGGDAPVLVPPELAQFGIFSCTGLTATVDAEAGTLSLSVEGAANTKAPDGYLVEATRPVSAASEGVFAVVTGLLAAWNTWQHKQINQLKNGQKNGNGTNADPAPAAPPTGA